MANTTIMNPPPPVAPRKTPLARHVGFFDPANTGQITLKQTYEGLVRLGIRAPWRFVLPPIINGFLGYLTQKRPSLTIAVARIADGKHPFDSGTFDDNGEIDSDAFEALFAGVAGDALTVAEMRAVIVRRGNRRRAMGRLAGVLGNWFSGKEVRLFFCLAADTTKLENGALVPAVSRRTLARFYDGTLLYALGRRHRMVLAGIRLGSPPVRALS